MKPLLKSRILLLILIIVGNGKMMSQEAKENKSYTKLNKYMIGLQLNPEFGIDEIGDLFGGSFDNIYMVASLRGAKRFTNATNLLMGFETSVYWRNKYYFNSQLWHFGPLIRYEYFRYKRLCLFAEMVPTFNYYFINYIQNQLTPGFQAYDKEEFKFGVYFAPGINLSSKSGRWSFDITLKASTYKLVNGKNFAPSFKVNFNF